MQVDKGHDKLLSILFKCGLKIIARGVKLNQTQENLKLKICSRVFFHPLQPTGGKMKVKWLIVLGLFSLLVACTPNAGVFTDASMPIIINEGDRFSIELPSNATTGYSWSFTTPVDGNYLTVIKDYYTAPETNLVGAGGTQGWQFEAVQSGSTVIQLQYKRPWETTEPAIQTVIFNITIQ
jgi:inhibitor of cysteine peptidase